MAKPRKLGLRDIHDAETNDRKRKLLVDTILEGLDAEDREWLEGALRDSSISRGHLVRVLKRAGIQASEHALRSWRDAYIVKAGAA